MAHEDTNPSIANDKNLLSPRNGFTTTKNGNMSASAQQGNFGNGGKKAVHVKWAGKTIALGTFPAAEADEKCARAKALTRAWRSTMRPKPSRDWVMLELERLGVRVVSGRLGRKAGDEDDAEKKVAAAAAAAAVTASNRMPPMDRNNSMGWNSNADLDTLMQRRSSSLGLSLIDNHEKRRGSLGSLGPALGLDAGDPAMPPHRPFVGGGAAAAFEAKRADHYAQKQQRRASSLGLGIGGGGNLPGGAGMHMGLSVNPNQHYEMLKLHHMNLLNEIQETTLMMNLYQQQQIQQQQQQLHQQTGGDPQVGTDQMSMLLQQQSVPSSGMDQLYANPPGVSQRGSLGMGPSSDEQQMQMIRQHQAIQGGVNGGHGMTPASATSGNDNVRLGANGNSNNNNNNNSVGDDPSIQDELLKGQQEQIALEERLKRLREDIAKRQKEAEDLEAKKMSQMSPSADTKMQASHSSMNATEDGKRKLAANDEDDDDNADDDDDDDDDEGQAENEAKRAKIDHSESDSNQDD